VHTPGRTGARMGVRITNGEVPVTPYNITQLVNIYLNTAFFFISGTTMRQINGIPIGGAKSPPLAILSCAFKEHALLSINPPLITVEHFTMRYIDDILTFILIPDNNQDPNIINTTWTTLTSAYPEQIQIEDVPTKVNFKFLEYNIEIVNNRITSSLHNKNITDPTALPCSQTFPRFPHYLGPASDQTKKSVLTTMIHAAHAASSSNTQLLQSTNALFQEFRALQYPSRFIRNTFITTIARRKSPMWTAIRSQVLSTIQRL